MSRIREILQQLPVSIPDIIRGIGWGDERLHPNVDFRDAQEEAERQMVLDIAGAGGPETLFDGRQFRNLYVKRLWCVIIFLAALYENKDYRKKESGLFNCQSAVFYLDTVAKNFSAMIEAMEKTTGKLTEDGNPTRAELYKGLVEELKDLKDKILNVRGIINRY